MKHRNKRYLPRTAERASTLAGDSRRDAGEALTEAQRELDRTRRRKILLDQVGAGVVPFFAARHPRGGRERS